MNEMLQQENAATRKTLQPETLQMKCHNRKMLQMKCYDREMLRQGKRYNRKMLRMKCYDREMLRQGNAKAMIEHATDRPVMTEHAA